MTVLTTVPMSKAVKDVQNWASCRCGDEERLIVATMNSIYVLQICSDKDTIMRQLHGDTLENTFGPGFLCGLPVTSFSEPKVGQCLEVKFTWDFRDGKITTSRITEFTSV